MIEMNLKHGALREAVRRTDISLFGFIWDMYSQRFEEPFSRGIISAEERDKRVLATTLDDPIIKRVGVDAVLQAFAERTCGTQHFSPASRQALGRYAQVTTSDNSAQV